MAGFPSLGAEYSSGNSLYACVWTHARVPIPHYILRLRVSLESAPEPDISASKASAELSVKPRSSSMQGALRQRCAAASRRVPEVCKGCLQASLLVDRFCHLDLHSSTSRVICWGAACSPVACCFCLGLGHAQTRGGKHSSPPPPYLPWRNAAFPSFNVYTPCSVPRNGQGKTTF